MIKVETGAGGRRKALVQGNMTIYEAAADKPALLGALTDATEMEIDLSSVVEMDTAGLQLHSEASLDVLDRYSLAGYFGDPVVVSPRKRKKAPAAGSRATRRRS